jgi:hypothetical protein
VRFAEMTAVRLWRGQLTDWFGLDRWRQTRSRTATRKQEDSQNDLSHVSRPDLSSAILAHPSYL